MHRRIDSLQNEKIKSAKKLAVSAKERREQKAFFAEGVRLCEDAVKSGLSIKTFFYTAKAKEKYPEVFCRLEQSAAQCFEIAPAVSEKLSDTEAPQGFFCVCAIPEQTAAFDPAGVYLALDRVRDPANFGAVCRTAEALGLSGAILYDCCDPFGPKALRAAMGSLFRLPLFETDDLVSFLNDGKAQGMVLFATTPDAAAPSVTAMPRSGGVIAVIGNEANGVSEDVFSVCGRVTIPMRGNAESLNASAAAAITMWELMRSREAQA